MTTIATPCVIAGIAGIAINVPIIRAALRCAQPQCDSATYLAAMQAEQSAWDALTSASASAVELEIAAVGIPPGELRERADWTARLAAVREGICRDSWHQASDALAEAAANRSARSSAMTPTA